MLRANHKDGVHWELWLGTRTSSLEGVGLPALQRGLALPHRSGRGKRGKVVKPLPPASFFILVSPFRKLLTPGFYIQARDLSCIKISSAAGASLATSGGSSLKLLIIGVVLAPVRIRRRETSWSSS